LQRIAAEIIILTGNEETQKIFKINYFDFRDMKCLGIETVNVLAKQQYFAEPKIGFEHSLTAIWFQSQQVKLFKAKYSIFDEPVTKNIFKEEAEKLLSEHNNRNIAVYLLLKKYGKLGSKRSVPYLQVAAAGVMVGISGWPENKEDGVAWENYRGKVNRRRRKGEQLLKNK